MKRSNQWTLLAALFVALLAFAGCQGESPTAPPPIGGGGGGSTPGGGTPPPTNAVVQLAVSNQNPLVGSTSTITATVTLNGQPVTNGTAVEFSTNLGAFADSNRQTSLRTTTGGVANAVLTSSAAGTATVTVRVNNVSAVTQVTFRTQPVDPPPTDTNPVITSISPSTGSPEGGQQVVITGRNFEGPVRVLFDNVPAGVISVTPTEIRVVTPPMDLGPSQQAKEVTITVITRQGSPDERRATGGPFRYELQILTPLVYHISPASGPNEGGTRITIFGEGFQAPVRVFFGTGGGPGPLADQTEAQVLQVSFGQIIALTPPAGGLGAPLANQQVTVRVLNVASNKEVSMPLAFRYGPEMRITSVGPTTGLAFSPQLVTITGWGFDEPVAVTIGGIAATPTFVSGTKIIARTGIPVVEGCSGGSGPVSVTNLDDGTSAEAEGIEYEFRVPPAAIISVTPNPVVAGSTVTVVVANAGGGTHRFQIGTTSVLPTTAVVDAEGTGTFTLVVPSSLQFDERPCTVLGVTGEQFADTAFDLIYRNSATECEDTIDNGLTVTPTDTSCRVPPPNATVEPATHNFGNVTVGTSVSQIVTVGNDGGSPLTVNSIAEVVDSPEYVVSGDTCTGTVVNPSGSCTFTLTFTPASVGTNKTVTVRVTTTANDPSMTATGNGI